MYLQDSDSNSGNTLDLLASAASSPAQAMLDNPEVKEAFEESLRDLAEDILKYHPGLAHILVGMSESPCPVVHGQN